MKTDLVIIGHILNETIKFPDRTISPVLGSPVAYSSVAAARLGVETGIVTKIGKDMPRELLKHFVDAGVDTLGMKTEGDTTRNLLIYDKQGNKTLEFLKKAPDIFYNDIPKEYMDAKIFCVSPIDYEVPISTVEDLHKAGKFVAVDLGGYGGATCDEYPDAKEQKEHTFLKKLLKNVNIAKASKEDCRHIFGEDRPGEAEIAALFTEYGAQIGVITLNKGGAVVVEGKKTYNIPPFKTKEVDATGAGDTFNAGFLCGYIWTRNVQQAGVYGCATASLVIEKSGGVLASRMPTRQDIEKRIKGN